MTELKPESLLKSRYKIIEQLGQGGMGEVYLAEDQSLANQVAVKANHNLSAHATAQFIREARLLASLKHPNLPRVIDYFHDEDSQYLVMDYIPGSDLRTVVENKNPLSLPLILKWAEQLGNALNYLHTQNPPIYHRDVKPANIKLTPNGEAVLVDFGIAKTGDPSQETQSGAWGYTPGFAPPEQVSGLRTGPYSDQFSLAATLYYLIAGQAPADSAQRMMGSGDLIPLKTLKADLPDHLSEAIQKAMSIKPEARFSTVLDFISALTHPIPIPDPASMQQTIASTQRPVSSPPLPPTNPVPIPADGSNEKPRKKMVGWIIGAIVVLLGVGGFFLLRATGIIGKPATPDVLPTHTLSVILPQEETQSPTSTPQETAIVNPTLAPTDAPTLAPTEPAPSYTSIGRGGKVAFISNRQADGYNQVWLMEVVQDDKGTVTGINPTQLTFTEGNKSNPAWSADGTKLVFSGWNSGNSPNGTPLADDIWMLDLTQPDAQPVDLSLRPRDDKYPSFSPTGKVIAFTSYYRDDGMPQLFLMNLDGNNQIRLSEGFAESYSSWTPNGDFLLYVLTTGQLNVLYMRDKFNSFKDSQKFDRQTDEGRLGIVSDPDVSLDGSMLAYTRILGTKTNIYFAPFTDRGRTVTAMTDSGADYSPCWSPDGEWLLFTSERDGNAEIYIMNREGGGLTNITNFPSLEKDPTWQPVPMP